MSIRKSKMATEILILLYLVERGNSIDVFENPQQLHSQKLRTVIVRGHVAALMADHIERDCTYHGRLY